MQRIDRGKGRHQCVGELSEIPVRDLRLLAETVAAALRIRRVRRPVEIEIVDPAVRPVIDGQAEDRHVVRVHYPVHETHAHPVRNHARSTLANLREPFGTHAIGVCAARQEQLRKIATNGEVDQFVQKFEVVARSRQLEVAETDEGRRHPAYDRARFGFGIAVIEHVAHHRLPGRDQAQRARRRHTQVVHGFAAQEFANRGAQHGTSVGGA